MLGKRHSKEDFSDVRDDLKRSFFAGEIQAAIRFDFVSKKCFRSSKIRGSQRSEVYLGLPQLSKMERFVVTINSF